MADQAFSSPGRKLSLEAAADLSSSQFLGAVVNSSGDAAVAGIGVPIIGVIQNKPAAAGRATELMVTGTTKMFSGAAVTAGDDVAVDAAGKAVDAASGNHVLGLALTTVANADEILSVELGVGQRVHP